MPERKSAFKRAPMQSELKELIESSKKVVMTEEDWHEQCISFVYGNAPESSRITKEFARASMKYIT